MTLHTLSSGSQGNCLLLSDGGTHILVDAGISTRRIKAAVGAEPPMATLRTEVSFWPVWSK